MASKREGVIRMFNGRMVDVFNLQPEDVVPINFIHALSLINRFTGASPWPISVMQHSLKMEEYIFGNGEGSVKPNSREDWYQLRRCALVHDWSEALFNDLASPVKKEFAGYRMHEDRAHKVIFNTLKIPLEYLDRIKWIDKEIYRDEVNSTWGIQNDPYDSERKGLGVKYIETEWRTIKQFGILRFVELFPTINLLSSPVL